MKSGALYEISDPVEQIEEQLVRLKALKRMWDGIPTEHIDLDVVLQNKTTKEAFSIKRPGPACGTVACLAGWAWMYPDFIKAGLRKLGKRTSWNNKPTQSALEAADDFFGVDIWETSDYDYEKTNNHKKEARNRINDAISDTEYDLRWTKDYQSSVGRM